MCNISHINKQLRTKLDAKSHKCILVGYGNDCKAYWIWDPWTDKVFYSRDVIFDETQIGIKSIEVEDPVLLEEGDLEVSTFDEDQEYDIKQITQE